MIFNNLNQLFASILFNGMTPSIRNALTVVKPEMVEDKNQRLILDAINQLDRFNSAVDFVSVSDFLKNEVPISTMAEYVKNIVPSIDPVATAMQIASLHNDKVAAVELKKIQAMIASGKPFERSEISKALRDLSELVAPKSKAEPVSYFDYVTSYINVLESRQENQNSQMIDLGVDLKAEKTALIVVGGQPGMGKTAFALWLNNHVAEQGHETLIFSLEMGGEQLFERQVSAISKIPTRRLKNIDKDENDLTPTQWGLIGNALQELEKLNVYIDDEAAASVEQIISKCKDFKEKHPKLGLITIDYLTLMKLPHAASRALSVGEATRMLKLLAKEIKTPVLLLSQLNREADKALREPRNSDLRDSGAIEQDADIILFPYREEVHIPDSPNKGLAKIIKSKVRDDETGSHIMQFSQGSFYPFHGEWKEQAPKEESKERRKF